MNENNRRRSPEKPTIVVEPLTNKPSKVSAKGWSVALGEAHQQINPASSQEHHLQLSDSSQIVLPTTRVGWTDYHREKTSIYMEPTKIHGRSGIAIPVFTIMQRQNEQLIPVQRLILPSNGGTMSILDQPHLIFTHVESGQTVRAAMRLIIPDTLRLDLEALLVSEGLEKSRARQFRGFGMGRFRRSVGRELNSQDFGQPIPVENDEEESRS